MTAPEKPRDEGQRLHALNALNILDSLPEERFDRLTRLARKMFGVPISAISLVDESRQWFKSIVGLNASETTRDVSFCGHAILGQSTFVVANALTDPRFADNPLVTGEPYIRSYAGAPLRLPGGETLGTLCIIDTRPRQFTSDDLSALEDLARIAEQEMIAVEMNALDELTMLPNRRGFRLLSQYMISRAKSNNETLSLLLFDIDKFKEINDKLGHAAGDRALIDFSISLKNALRETDIVARTGGDEFVVLAHASSEKIGDMLARFNHVLRARLSEQRASYALEYSVGHVEYDYQRHSELESCLAEADRLMYQQKHGRRAPSLKALDGA